ncbi:MAG: hypothetical protein LUC87_08190 [Clostridiales bacterium]|nr:hypothetical protein [Clostridiales bacterium]
MKNKKLNTLTAFLLAVAMMLSLAACGGSTSEEGGSASLAASSESGASNTSGEASSEADGEASSSAEAESEATEETTETITVDGVDYYLLYAYNCENNATLLDEQFAQYYEGGDTEAGLRAITDAGNVYVNGIRIPYTTESGEPSVTEMVVNDENYIMQQEGGWIWMTHITRQWDDEYNMPYLEGEEDYVAGQYLSLEDAAFKYTEYLAIFCGQTVELYAEVGSEYASLITTTMLSSALVDSIETADGVTTYYDADDEIIVQVAEENADEAIQPDDVMLYWDEYEDGVETWYCRRAVSYYGVLVENTDPDNEDAIKEPYFQVTGSDELMTTGDSEVVKNIAECYRHTQFIRGHRRTDQYNYDGEVIMWCTNESPDTVIAFTRTKDSAYGALEHAIAYAEEVTAEVVVSADGSDVAADTYWVTEDIWSEYEEGLAEAKAVLEDAESTANDYNEMVLELANVLGGTEDLNSTSPMKMNPLGVVGSMALGTMAE